MTFNRGDMIDTTQGIYTVQCPLTFVPNNNIKYNKLGGRTLYWLQDLADQDVFLWDNELEKILTEEEKLSENVGDENDLF